MLYFRDGFIYWFSGTGFRRRFVVCGIRYSSCTSDWLHCKPTSTDVDQKKTLPGCFGETNDRHQAKRWRTVKRTSGHKVTINSPQRQQIKRARQQQSSPAIQHAERALRPRRLQSTLDAFNPLESRGNYSAHKKYEVGTLSVDGWAVTFGTARRGLDEAAARPGPSSLYQM